MSYPKYLLPEGCGYISNPDYYGPQVRCVCKEGWGHKATEWENFKRSGPPSPPTACLYVFNTACGCQRQVTGSFPPLPIYRLPLTPKLVWGPVEMPTTALQYATRDFELTNMDTLRMVAHYQEKR